MTTRYINGKEIQGYSENKGWDVRICTSNLPNGISVTRLRSLDWKPDEFKEKTAVQGGAAVGVDGAA